MAAWWWNMEIAVHCKLAAAQLCYNPKDKTIISQSTHHFKHFLQARAFFATIVAICELQYHMG